MSLRLLSIKPSTDPEKKYMATFERNGRQLTTHFGAKGYTDFIASGGDKERRARYLQRHAGMGENWNDPTTAGALSRWILWGEYPSLNKNISAFRKRFNL
jgi:hypothetical protein